MRQNPHVRICGGPGSATTLVYPTGPRRESRQFRYAFVVVGPRWQSPGPYRIERRARVRCSTAQDVRRLCDEPLTEGRQQGEHVGHATARKRVRRLVVRSPPLLLLSDGHL